MVRTLSWNCRRGGSDVFIHRCQRDVRNVPADRFESLLWSRISPFLFIAKHLTIALAVVPNRLTTNRAQKAVSEFDAFASHSAGESGFVKGTAASPCKARRSQTHDLRDSNLRSLTGRLLRWSRAGQRRSNIAPDGRVQATRRPR